MPKFQDRAAGHVHKIRDFVHMSKLVKTRKQLLGIILMRRWCELWLNANGVHAVDMSY